MILCSIIERIITVVIVYICSRLFIGFCVKNDDSIMKYNIKQSKWYKLTLVIIVATSSSLFLTEYNKALCFCIFETALIINSFFDLKIRQSYDIITYVSILLMVIVAMASGKVTSITNSNNAYSIIITVVTLLVMIVFSFMGLFGAGDIKMLIASQVYFMIVADKPYIAFIVCFIITNVIIGAVNIIPFIQHKKNSVPFIPYMTASVMVCTILFS